MTVRRDILKLFGAGALIAPIIGSSADESAAAQLIDTPKIRPVELFGSIPKIVVLGSTPKLKSAIIVLGFDDGRRKRIEIAPDDEWGTIKPAGEIEMSFREANALTSFSPLATSGFIHGLYR